MTPEHIITVIAVYEEWLTRLQITKTRMNPVRTMGALNKYERLAHAHFLCTEAKELARDPDNMRKAGSYLFSVQCCLSFAGWYTLEDLMEHNRSAPNSPSFTPIPYRR